MMSSASRIESQLRNVLPEANASQRRAIKAAAQAFMAIQAVEQRMRRGQFVENADSIGSLDRLCQHLAERCQAAGADHLRPRRYGGALEVRMAAAGQPLEDDHSAGATWGFFENLVPSVVRHPWVPPEEQRKRKARRTRR